MVLAGFDCGGCKCSVFASDPRSVLDVTGMDRRRVKEVDMAMNMPVAVGMRMRVRVRIRWSAEAQADCNHGNSENACFLNQRTDLLTGPTVLNSLISGPAGPSRMSSLWPDAGQHWRSTQASSVRLACA